MLERLILRVHRWWYINGYRFTDKIVYPSKKIIKYCYGIRLGYGLDMVTYRWEEVCVKYCITDISIEDLAKEYHMTTERVRQILSKYVRKYW